MYSLIPKCGRIIVYYCGRDRIRSYWTGRRRHVSSNSTVGIGKVQTHQVPVYPENIDTTLQDALRRLKLREHLNLLDEYNLLFLPRGLAVASL
jgi:hypothetical protein